jgi:glycosyltransferase involved in cell wall biosynthesis
MHSPEAQKTRHAIVAVAPTFNNERTVRDIVSRALERCGGIVVIDDGSTDDTRALLEEWKKTHPEDNVRVIRHEVNRGKAEALKTGFKAAARAGYTHALTIDTDGQHDPDEIPDFRPERISKTRNVDSGSIRSASSKQSPVAWVGMPLKPRY